MSHQTKPNIGATNNCAVASLILSIGFVVLGPFGSIPGIVCGHLALKGYNSAGIHEGRGLAKAGVVIGWIGLVLFMVGIALALLSLQKMYQIFDTIQNLETS